MSNTDDEEILFLNVSNPLREARAPSFRRTVRSHVTKKQHRDRWGELRLRDSSTVTSRSSSVSSPLGSPFASVDGHQHLIPSQSETAGIHTSTPPASISTLPQQQRDSIWKPPGVGGVETATCTCTTSGTHTTTCASCGGRATQVIMTPALRALQDPTDELGLCLRRLNIAWPFAQDKIQDFVDETLSQPLERVAGIPRVSTQNYVISLMLSDLAHLSSSALYCLAPLHKLTGGERGPSAGASTGIIQLHTLCLRTIQAGIEDTSLATSDARLAAVCALMVYEAVQGNRRIYALHGQGLVRMIRLRGGLWRPGDDKILSALLLHLDASAADLLGCSSFLDSFGRAEFPQLRNRLLSSMSSMRGDGNDEAVAPDIPDRA